MHRPRTSSTPCTSSAPRATAARRSWRAAAFAGAAALAAPAAAAAAEPPWFLPYARICSTANHPPARVELACTGRGSQPQVQAPMQAPTDPGTCQTDVAFPGYNLRFSWPEAGGEASCLCLDETGPSPAWVTYLKMSAQAGPEGYLDRNWMDLGAAGRCRTNGAVAGSR